MILVFLNGFFVTAEIAFLKVKGSRIDALAEEGHRKARQAQRILRNLDPYLISCQLGITLSTLALGFVGEQTLAGMLAPLMSATGWSTGVLHTISILITFAFIAIMHMIFGELAPKTVAVRKAETMTLHTANLIRGFYVLTYPVIWLVNGVSNVLLRVFRMTPVVEKGAVHTEEEILDLMKESSEVGLINDTELALVDNIFEFADTTAREIMIPRTDMICLYTNLSMEENLDIALNNMRTRYPICEEDKDHISGFIHIKDLMRGHIGDQLTLIRPIIAVPESIKISELLKRMQRSKTQIAILIDEYGGTSGLVTMEDIMEEIVGEIQDEFDQERQGIEVISEDEYSIDGLMLIEEINGHFGLNVDTEDYDTIGGWLSSKLEAVVPQVGQSYAFEHVLLVVEEYDHKRISRIRLIQQGHMELLEAGAS
ncbi:hemolysin family protein [Paenibacillus sp. JSM ZJ436]|uniref:Uncharacterized protein n=1 Tax=Paenibacillus algicola TaxID=2565926 RepID=A0A4P8XKI0_9BACL|nr:MULTISPECIES: hemolysin family protein [Paenibacillus]QCT02843.1 hypothetical protein E6C60_2128 [Paenibacillus algicola]